MKKITRIEKMELQVKELMGDNFTIYKDLTCCNVVKKNVENTGHTTVARFKKIGDLEIFIENLANLKHYKVIDFKN